MNDFIEYDASPDWDLFNTQTGHKTLGLWFWIPSLPSVYGLFHQTQISPDSNYRYYIYLDSPSGNVILNYVVAGSSIINNVVMGTITAGSWNHLALIFSETIVAGYLNGIQGTYNNSWSTYAFTGGFKVGDFYNGSNWFTGSMQDLYIVYNNPFNAQPNAGLTDTFDVPGGLMQLVM